MEYRLLLNYFHIISFEGRNNKKKILFPYPKNKETESRKISESSNLSEVTALGVDRRIIHLPRF